MKTVSVWLCFFLICVLVGGKRGLESETKLTELLSQKTKAVEVEDYGEAQRLKLLINDMQEIESLTAKKKRAVEEEDFVAAKEFQDQIKHIQQKGGVLNKIFDFGVGIRKGMEEEKTDDKGNKLIVDNNFISAFVASFSMIILSEIGDKTFFIAAIMAMRHNRLEIFLSAVSALAVMTVLSTAAGYALPTVLPREYTHFAASILFVFFGFKLLRDSWLMDPEAENEEMAEVEDELKGSKQDGEAHRMEEGLKGKRRKSCLENIFSPAFVQCFTMTFLAEWGDRSQIATIALAAAKDPFGVTLGGVIGHSICTGLAVIGGKLLATRISERMLAFAGGILFLLFSVHSFYVGPDSNS